MDTLDFYFDFISPYAYLGWKQLAPFAEQHGLEVRAHPVVFAGLLNHWGQLGPAEIEPKRIFTFQDIFRRAVTLGVPIHFPPHHPFFPIPALRIALAEVAGVDQSAVIDGLFDAVWGRGEAIDTPEAISAALAEARLDGDSLLARTQEPEIKQALRDSTEHAIERGVFGVPTMIYQGDLFWGSDQFPALAARIEKGEPLYDPDALAEFLAREPGAQRL